MSRLRRLLRSPRLALSLIAGVTVYAFLMTLVPQGDVQSSAVSSWRSANPIWAGIIGTLGLHSAWWWPPFLVTAILLIASTAVCAWDRTADAKRQWTRWRHLPSNYFETMLGARPPALRVHTEPTATAERVAETLRRRRMSVRTVDGGVWATARVWAVFGSSVFHWALVALFVYAALGQLTRWEGTISIVAGQSRPDVSASYLSITEGPLGLRTDTSRTLAVSKVQTDLAVSGTDIGLAAEVTLAEDSAPVKSELVYTNHLLKHRALMVHMDGWGLGTAVTVKGSDNQVLGQTQYPFDFANVTEGGRLAQQVELQTADGGSTPMVIALPLDPAPGGGYVRALPRPPRLELTFPTRTDEATIVVGVGDTARLPGGIGSMTVDGIDYTARLFVVEDWSVPWLYAMFALSCVAATVALLLPPRAVFVAIEAAADGGALVRVVPRHRRVDSAYPAMIRESIADAIGATEVDVGDRDEGITS